MQGLLDIGIEGDIMNKLTKEQAVIISGYTGIACCNFRHIHEDIEKRLGRPVYTHELGSEEIMNKIKDLYEDDFINLCYEGE